MNRRLRCVIAAGATALLLTTGCAPQPAPTTPLTVYASSSLIKSFTAIGKKFEASDPGYSVEFVFSDSAELSSAIANGANPDVFASGDRSNMAALSDAGATVGPSPVPFAANKLVIVVPVGNPRNITTLADLAAPGLRVAVCGDPGACGAATRSVERRYGVELHPQSTDAVAANVIKAVSSGQADAGIGFMSDALDAGDNVSWFALPADAGAVTSWIAVVKGTDQQSEASRFVETVTGDTGQKILAENGFVRPDEQSPR